MNHFLAILSLTAIVIITLISAALAKGHELENQLITYCYQDILEFDTVGITEVVVPRGNELRILFNADKSEFSVLRGPRTLFTQHIQDFSCDAKVLWAPDGKAFALNYSDGGAIGGFHVLVFSIQGDRISNISKAIKPAVDHFKARHFCKTRGNNVTALKWIRNSSQLVLMTDVYPTSDCGPDLGHTEGYVVSIPGGQIEQHLTLNQLKTFPGICLQNEEETK